MQSHRFSTDGDLDVRIRFVKLKQLWLHVLIEHWNIVEIDQFRPGSPGLRYNLFVVFGGGGGVLVLGRFTRIPFMWVWLKLTIMKLASRKNMMSISGIISMRACFFGMGDRILMIELIRRTRHGESNWNFDLAKRFLV